MKDSRSERTLLLSDLQLLAVEQWMALSIGLLCLGVAVWAGSTGSAAFSSEDHSRFAKDARNALGWSLTILVAMLGIALLRFAFSRRPDEDTEPSSATRKRSAGSAPGRAVHELRVARRGRGH
jgi:hypothetical protein